MVAYRCQYISNWTFFLREVDHVPARRRRFGGLTVLRRHFYHRDPRGLALLVVGEFHRIVLAHALAAKLYGGVAHGLCVCAMEKKKPAVDGHRRTHHTFFSLPTFKQTMSLLNTRSNLLQFKWGLVDAPQTNPNDTSNEDVVKNTVEKFNEKYRDSDKANDFTKHFFARLQRIRWASELPKDFAKDAIEHVLNWQSTNGYMKEYPDRSAEEAIQPFFERYNFLSYDAELGRRRDACNRGYIDYEYVKQPRYDTYLLSDQVDKKVERNLDSNGRNVAGAARQLSRDKINTNISSQVRDRLNMQVRNISKSYRDMQGKVRDSGVSRYRFT